MYILLAPVMIERVLYWHDSCPMLAGARLAAPERRYIQQHVQHYRHILV